MEWLSDSHPDVMTTPPLQPIIQLHATYFRNVLSPAEAPVPQGGLILSWTELGNRQLVHNCWINTIFRDRNCTKVKNKFILIIVISLTKTVNLSINPSQRWPLHILLHVHGLKQPRKQLNIEKVSLFLINHSGAITGLIKMFLLQDDHADKVVGASKIRRFTNCLS